MLDYVIYVVKVIFPEFLMITLEINSFETIDTFEVGKILPLVFFW